MSASIQMQNKSIRKKYAIEINKENLLSLVNLLSEYYPDKKLEIGANLADNRTVVFSDIEKLLSYDNYGSSRIISLAICSDQHYKFIFTGRYSKKEFFIITTIRADFMMDEHEKYILLLNKLEKVLGQMKLPLWNTVGMNACLPITTILSFIGFYWFFVIYLKLPFEITTVFILALLIVGLAFAITVLCKPLWQMLLAPVHFSWGGEMKRLQRANTFIVYILGVITGLLVNFLSGHFF